MRLKQKSMKLSMNENSTKNLVKKGRKNALTGIMYFVVNTITALIITPILVNYLGSYYFGIWKSIEKFIGFAGIADGQGTQALKWTIAHEEAKHDYYKKRRLIASSFVVWTLFLPILVALIGLFLYYSPYIINEVDSTDLQLVYMIIVVLGINLVITPLFAIPESILVGTNRGHIANKIKIIWLIVTFIMTYLIVVFEYGLVELSIIIVIVTAVRGIHYFFIVRKLIPWLGLEKPKRDELKSFFKFSSWKLIWAFNARFLLSSEIIFLTILVSPQSVSQYIFSSYIPVIGILLSAIVTSAFNPGIGRLVGNKEYETSQKFIVNLRESVLAFGVFIGAITLLLNKSFIFLWSNQSLYLGDTINLFIVILMIQLIIIRNESFLIDLSLNIKKKVLLGVLSLIISSILVVAGYSYTGCLWSIFVGLFLGRMLLIVLFPIITNKMVQIDKKNIPIGTFFAVTFILIGAYILGGKQFFETWYELVLFGLVESILCAIIVYALVLKQENKRVIKLKVLNIFKGES